MKWIEIKKQRPPHGELVWVWDMDNSYQFLVRYMGDEDTWFRTKEDTRFPIWAHLNEEEEEKEDAVDWGRRETAR